MVRMKQAGNARRSEKQCRIGFQPVFIHTFERCFIPAHKLQNQEFQPSAEWREDSAIQPWALYTIRRNGGYLKASLDGANKLQAGSLCYFTPSRRGGDGFTLDRANARRSEEQCC